MKTIDMIMVIVAVFFCMAVFRSCATNPAPAPFNYNLIKDENSILDLKRIQKATHTVLGVCFYAREDGSGRVIFYFGRGIVMKSGDELLFLSLYHIVDFEKTIKVPVDPDSGCFDQYSHYFATFSKASQPRIFIFSDWTHAYKCKVKWNKLMSEAGGFVSLEFYENIFNDEELAMEAIELDLSAMTRGTGKEEVVGVTNEPIYFKIDKKFTRRVDYISREDLASETEIREWQKVIVWGNPQLTCESLREGIVASATFFYFKTEKRLSCFFVCSMATARGTSGSPVMATCEGRLKIVGFTSIAFTRAPFQGVVYKIKPFLKKVGLE